MLFRVIEAYDYLTECVFSSCVSNVNFIITIPCTYAVFYFHVLQTAWLEPFFSLIFCVFFLLFHYLYILVIIVQIANKHQLAQKCLRVIFERLGTIRKSLDQIFQQVVRTRPPSKARQINASRGGLHPFKRLFNIVLSNV